MKKNIIITIITAIFIALSISSCSKDKLIDEQKQTTSCLEETTIYLDEGYFLNKIDDNFITTQYGVKLSINENIYNEYGDYYAELALYNTNDTVYLIYYGDIITSIEGINNYLYYAINYFPFYEGLNFDYDLIIYNSENVTKYIYKFNQKQFTGEFGLNGLPTFYYIKNPVYIPKEALEKAYIELIKI